MKRSLKIATILGARPQFIKASVVSRALSRAPRVREVIVHTGQHYDERLSQIFFNELQIPPPDHSLEIGSGTHGDQTGRMLAAIERVLIDERPDWVLVYGDTNSTLAGALAAVKLQMPIAHVEAGLRSFNRHMPEEINRVLTDHAADLLLAPTASAVELLANEGIARERIERVGDVMFDVARCFGEQARRSSMILSRLSLPENGYVVATVHRPENTDDAERLTRIFAALETIAEQMPVVVPLHPRTWRAREQAGLTGTQRVRLIEPLGYLDMARLTSAARLMVTDSGGVQKEAYFHGVPCVTLRGETEWTELATHGGQRLHRPVEHAALVSLLGEMLSAPRPTPDMTLFGDGHAAEKIVQALLDRA